MKKFLLLIFLILFYPPIHAQQGTKGSPSYANLQQKTSGTETSNIKVNIYPVPVINNYFSIKSDRDISFIKITNIIGQDIYKSKYNSPQQLIRIDLDSPQRGMYLVTIIFSDGMRIVKKIMIEESK